MIRMAISPIGIINQSAPSLLTAQNRRSIINKPPTLTKKALSKCIRRGALQFGQLNDRWKRLHHRTPRLTGTR